MFRHPLQWLSQRDRELGALRRAGRAAIAMPATFALGKEVIANPVLATFAAFGSFAMLLLVDFSGPMRDRLRAQLALAAVGCVFVCLGTLVSQTVWLAALAMGLVGFAVLFSGVVSSVLAGASTSLLLAFILPVTLSGPPASIPDRVAGWGLAAGASLLAVGLLWPAPMRGPLREAAAALCHAVAVRLRAEAAFLLGGEEQALARDRDHAVERSDRAFVALRRVFLATPYRPASLSTTGRATIRLVDELNFLGAIVAQSAHRKPGTPVNRAACAVKIAAANVLERGAELLESMGGDCAELRAATRELENALAVVERDATADLSGDEMESITALDPSFRAQELGFSVGGIARNIDLAAAAERRSWLQRLLGRQPPGVGDTLSAAQVRLIAHFDRGSVWLHNSVRGAVGLALAVLVANETGVQHSFWVVLGTLSVLRSNALNTGQNALRGIAGTVVGFVVGGALLQLIGTSTTLLWLLLPVAILLAGVAPAVISFAAGQAAFTLTLVFLYNIIQPIGWKVGLLRVEDIAIGCAVSLVVGLLFWPRGAGAALRRALAEAYVEGARYLASAIDFGMRRCDVNVAAVAVPEGDAARAAAAARRLDDTFRSFLAERGEKPAPLAEVTALLGGAGGLRLAGDAVLDLWRGEDGSVPGDRARAREQLTRTSLTLEGWYGRLAKSLLDRSPLPEPLAHDTLADDRLLEAVRRDLRGEHGHASATAVRMVWTGDHLDAVRRLQHAIVEPARVTVAR
jgi:uncharacterized membrane protein YccC